MSFIDGMIQKAKTNKKTICLPEGNDSRILKAAEQIVGAEIANIIILGNKGKIEKLAEENDVSLKRIKIITPTEDENFEKFVNEFYELRKDKGIKYEDAAILMKDEVYYGTMLLKNGFADGLVAGACHATPDTLRPALQILKSSSKSNFVSSFFIMDVPDCSYGEDGLFLFADSGLNVDPDAEKLAKIAVSSAESFERLIGKSAKVAMLSYSTCGSASSGLTKKVVDATLLVKNNNPEIICDGELQLDAAIVPEVAQIKAPQSPLEGKANVLIFPDLNSGNIGYKLVQRLGRAKAYGPLCQGMLKPVNDLSRGCSVSDIVGIVAITAVQAQQ